MDKLSYHNDVELVKKRLGQKNKLTYLPGILHVLTSVALWVLWIPIAHYGLFLLGPTDLGYATINVFYSLMFVHVIGIALHFIKFSGIWNVLRKVLIYLPGLLAILSYIIILNVTS